MSIDILGIDILGIDVLALPPSFVDPILLFMFHVCL